MRAIALLLAAASLAGLSAAARASGDPGILLQLDHARSALVVRDLRAHTLGPELAVATGSPESPTPAGTFPIALAILNPAWVPPPSLRALGARPQPPSLDSPMGAAKLPFAENGSVALHGGGDPSVLGYPVSAGCLRASNAAILRLLAWLHAQGALAPAVAQESGERHRAALRPIRIRIPATPETGP